MDKEKIKQLIFAIVLIAITIVFFGYNVVICVDSSHYCWLSSLLTDRISFSNWDVARGIVFPFIIYFLTVVIGNNVISLQIGMYIAYMLALLTVYIIYKEIIGKENNNKFIKIFMGILFLFLIALNPLIFGYYHVILTEFISMTACIVASYLAWKWIDVNFFENKLKYIIYTIYFAISMAFMWHLKQPYVLTILAPLIISSILAIIKNLNWKNILQRLFTVLICLITLLVSIKLWNFILEKTPVSIDETRTSSSFLSNQILGGMTEYSVVSDKNQYNIENVKINKKISDEDKGQIEEIIKGESEEYKNFILIECAPYRNLEESKEIKVLYTKENNLSIIEALKFEFSILIENPKSILKGYFNNYMTTIGIYRAQTVGIGAIVTEEISWTGTYENSYIAYNIYRDMSNNLNVPEHYEPYIENYNGINRQIKIVNIIFEKTGLIAIYMFKIILLLVPLMFLFSFIMVIALKIKRKNNKKIKVYELLTILYGYSFLNVMMYSALGALIDRYAISSYISANVAIFIHISYLLTLILNKIKEKGKR